jgi:hypothetical protein
MTTFCEVTGPGEHNEEKKIEKNKIKWVLEMLNDYSSSNSETIYTNLL